MARRPASRLQALLLALLLLSGGGGTPLLDVILFHAKPTARAPGSHVRPADAAWSHGDLCRLGRTLPTSPVAAPAALAGRVPGTPLRAPLVLAEPAPRWFDLPFPSHPRPPPSRFA
ncbi:MAG TPA: hypothetical protein VFU46_02240 [Gemmatimonadales bacterium]|nr:hypothetical protein [Gemmatimonadales bacterium]